MTARRCFEKLKQYLGGSAIFQKTLACEGLRKIAKPPKYCFSFSKQRIPENNISFTFLDFFPASTLKFFSWGLCLEIFVWPQITQTITYVLGMILCSPNPDYSFIRQPLQLHILKLTFYVCQLSKK